MKFWVDTPEKRVCHELYMSYMRGWRDGACSKAMNPKFTEHKTRPDLKEVYEEAYQHGRLARGRAFTYASDRFDYVPNVLRSDQQEQPQK